MDITGVKTKEYVCGLFYNNIQREELMANINHIFHRKKKGSIYFLNADCVNKSCKDQEYRRILRNSSLVLADGIGIQIATGMSGGKMAANLNGTDLLPHLCEFSIKNKKKVYLLGAKPGVAEKMKNNLEASYPGIEVVGFCDGYFERKTEGKVLEEISDLKADIVLVAMGVPLQEKWISKNRASISSGLVLGVGGLFDFYSGNIVRAPKWIRSIGMEWLFRLSQEPKRLWRRYIIGNPLFLMRAALWAISRRLV